MISHEDRRRILETERRLVESGVIRDDDDDAGDCLDQQRQQRRQSGSRRQRRKLPEIPKHKKREFNIPI